MQPISWTAAQHEAVRKAGCSVLVSAAAGSGKTAVLAERCAYLVCEAPADQRCDADSLLVLTFTEAAAAQMRARIVDAIRQRVETRPSDARLREQVYLVEVAQISTIHSFCLWCIRRWFSELGVDPNAAVLDEDEAVLLRREVLDSLFSSCYADGRTATPEPEGKGVESLGSAFVRLVDDYGLGEDREVAKLVLKLADFVDSLPDPEAWLVEAEAIFARREQLVLRLGKELARELVAQAEECEQILADLKNGPCVVEFYGAQIQDYLQQLRRWTQMSQGNGATDLRALRILDDVCKEIAAFEFNQKQGPRLCKDQDEALRVARDAAREQLNTVKKDFFEERLKNRFALFSVAERLDGLAQTVAYVGTVVRLVRNFREAYRTKKRQLNVLDFADLERLTFDLLTDGHDRAKPSAVARRLQDRFAHVLVDEFQDINPLQQAILSLVSRESDPTRADNLFAVGDIKQSIYRFRLAEPALFVDRMRRFRDGRQGNRLISLQSNFRSRKEILDVVNLLFSAWMRADTGDVVYDQEAVLLPGREDAAARGRQAVELHLLERGVAPQEVETETPGRALVDPGNPAMWSAMEREAYLIGSRILDLVGTATLGFGEPLDYKDIVILLRSAKVNAEQMAAILGMMGIPVFADVGGSLLDAREIRDVLAALRVFDNLQQDIPLAAVLRGGVLGPALTDDDLAAVRCLDREVAFHEAVTAYAQRGDQPDLRRRLTTLLQRIDRYRDEMRRRPLADVLWSLYDRHGFLAYVCGLPRGAQREANLLRLHELARKFGTFRRQGLHRFLRFLDAMKEEDRTLASPARMGEGENVVRVMSVHHGKGLEFPVVFVAGLGTRFNLDDRRGRIIFERSAKIGLRVVDPDRLIEYPSAAHILAALEIERRTREEELRILYVAVTRAREKLVLVGSLRDVDRLRAAHEPVIGRRPSRLKIIIAAHALDWIVPALRAAPPGTVRGLGDRSVQEPLVEVHLHDAAEISRWRAEEQAPDASGLRQAAAQGLPLPPGEPVGLQDSQGERIFQRIKFVYPALSAASLRAAVTASEFKGAFDFTRNLEEREDVLETMNGHKTHTQAKQVRDALAANDQQKPKIDTRGLADFAIRRGVITHRIMQHLDFQAARNAAGLTSELQRMSSAGWLSADDRLATDEGSLLWFVSTPLAEAIRAAGPRYRREFPYLAAELPEYFDPTVGPSPDDFVLVRGVIDGILPTDCGIEIIDFKTDAITATDVPAQAGQYRPQVQLYARAVARMWQEPVVAAHLVFLAAERIFAWRDLHRGGLHAR